MNIDVPDTLAAKVNDWKDRLLTAENRDDLARAHTEMDIIRREINTAFWEDIAPQIQAGGGK
jgi:hypothetical protein